MSQRQIIVDDHTMSVIGDEDAITTGTSITIQRGPEGITAWDGLNLSDDSFAKLVKLVSEFVGTEPQANEQAESSEQAAYEQQQAERQAVAVLVAAEKLATTPEPAKRDGKAVRAWWYALDSATIKALALPVPDRSRNIGKLPVAVYDAYDASRA